MVGALATLAVPGAIKSVAATPPPTFETDAIHAVGGEPGVAFNARDPANLVLANLSGIVVSWDHGEHWQYTAPSVADPQVVADPFGRFYATAAAEPSSPNVLGPGVLIQTSTDGGLSWGPAVQAFPNTGYAEAYDRPWLAVDSSDGTVYVTVARHRVAPGTSETPSGPVSISLPTTTKPGNEVTCNANVLDSGIFDCGDRIVSASHDGGRTWTPAHPEDSPDYPSSLTGGFGGIPVAAHGLLGVFYYSSAAPGHACPCVIFETSRDDGAHWQRTVVPGAVPHVNSGVGSLPAGVLIADGTSAVFGPYPAADPAHPGRFAVLMNDATNTHWLLYETNDYGRQWIGPVTLGQNDGNIKERPWLTFGPTGALGAFWRTDYAADSSFDVWAAVSTSGDIRGFGAPVRISEARSPNGGTSDDNSDATMDAHYLYMSWGDNRTDNQTEGWFGRYRYR